MNEGHSIQSLFETDMALLRNPICELCDAQLRHPLLPLIVGKQFEKTDERILFVGKPHRGCLAHCCRRELLTPQI